METRAKRRTVISLAVIGLFVAGGLTSSALNAALPSAALAQEATAEAEEGAMSELSVERVAFQDQMRKLWEDHITWTRLVIVSFAADLPDQELTAQRLLRNQTDIGDAVKPFYGEDAGNELTTLLEEHIQGAVELLAAAKAGDAAAVEAATRTGMPTPTRSPCF